MPTRKFFLPTNACKTQTYFDKISKWTSDHEMVLNPKKSKYMIMNFCQSKQFSTRLTINNSLIEQVSKTRLLGVIISEDLTWHANTQDLVLRANKRMLMLRKLSEFSVAKIDLITIYKLFIRSIIDQSSVVWSCSLTKEEVLSLGRIQKVALKIIYETDYDTYENALKMSNLSTVEERHKMLSLRFALKCTKSEKASHMFPLAPQKPWARESEQFLVPMARKERYLKSAIPSMARALNKHVKIKK